MNNLKLLYFPDPGLKLIAKKVDNITADTKETIANMFELMYKQEGVGLAATQVNVQQRIIVIDISHTKSEPVTLINPEIIEKSGERTTTEGCLSFPNIYAKVERYKEITIEYLDEHGQQQRIEAKNNLLCACIQHEIDHLDGITFFDHLSSLKQKMLREKIRKMKTK